MHLVHNYTSASYRLRCCGEAPRILGPGLYERAHRVHSTSIDEQRAVLGVRVSPQFAPSVFLNTTIGAVGALAASSYLDAKYHFRKDLITLWGLRKAARKYAQRLEEDRLCPFYSFEQHAQRIHAIDPSYECLWSRNVTYTWKQTYDESCRYANWLISEGAQKGELISFFLGNSIEFCVSLLATWALGTAPCLINYNLSGDSLIHCLKVGGSRIVLVDEEDGIRQRIEESRSRIEGELGMKIIILDAAKRAFISANFPATRPDDSWRTGKGCQPRDPIMLLFTSGTTGMPKAAAYHIERHHTQTFENMHRHGWYEGPGPKGTRLYDCMPLYHGTGGNVFCIAMTRGMTVAIGRKFSTRHFWDEIRASRATAFVYVGETLRYLLANPESPQDRNHNVITIFGNGVRPDVWKKFRDRFGIEIIAEFFNSTEGVFGLFNVARGDYFATSVGHHGLILRSYLHNAFIPIVVDPITQEVEREAKTGKAIRTPYDVGGEIIVRVPEKEAFIGYWKNPTATAKKFVRNLFDNDDLFYRSGDALRRDSDGRWFFLDRLGDTFRWKSENVSTAEVAEVLGHYPGIQEANVYGVLVPKHDGRAGCAALYIDPKHEARFDWSDLFQFMKQRLPRYSIPVFIRLEKGNEIEANTHNNKQNKVPLRNEGVDPEKIKNGHRPNDQILWLPQGEDTYRKFTERDWKALNEEKARL